MIDLCIYSSSNQDSRRRNQAPVTSSRYCLVSSYAANVLAAAGILWIETKLDCCITRVQGRTFAVLEYRLSIFKSVILASEIKSKSYATARGL